MQNKIEHLRNHLFATLEALQDEDKPMDVDRAKVVAEVAKVVVDSAKVEVEHMKVTGSKGSGFIPAPTLEGPQEPQRESRGKVRVIPSS